jgi:hypothetical protein
MIVTEMELALGLVVTLIVGVAVGQVIRVRLSFERFKRE